MSLFYPRISRPLPGHYLTHTSSLCLCQTRQTWGWPCHYSTTEYPDPSQVTILPTLQAFVCVKQGRPGVDHVTILPQNIPTPPRSLFDPHFKPLSVSNKADLGLTMSLFYHRISRPLPGHYSTHTSSLCLCQTRQTWGWPCHYSTTEYPDPSQVTILPTLQAFVCVKQGRPGVDHVTILPQNIPTPPRSLFYPHFKPLSVSNKADLGLTMSLFYHRISRPLPGHYLTHTSSLCLCQTQGRPGVDHVTILPQNIPTPPRSLFYPQFKPLSVSNTTQTWGWPCHYSTPGHP